MSTPLCHFSQLILPAYFAEIPRDRQGNDTVGHTLQKRNLLEVPRLGDSRLQFLSHIVLRKRNATTSFSKFYLDVTFSVVKCWNMPSELQ